MTGDKKKGGHEETYQVCASIALDPKHFYLHFVKSTLVTRLSFSYRSGIGLKVHSSAETEIHNIIICYMIDLQSISFSS